jgi:ATP-dependent Clp protease adaptor protein ClpS
VSEATTPQFDPGSNAVPVIVLNDDHNTFEWVAGAIAKTIPGVDDEQALSLAQDIHEKGHAVVWVGDPELARYYIAQLAGYSLTMNTTAQQRPGRAAEGLRGWMNRALWPGYSIFYFGLFAFVAGAFVSNFATGKDGHRFDAVFAILIVLSLAVGIVQARRAKRRAAQRAADSPQRSALARELAATRTDASPPGASPERQIEHLVTDDDPNTSLCGVDQTDVPWNEGGPICEACKAVAEGRLQRTRAAAESSEHAPSANAPPTTESATTDIPASVTEASSEEAVSGPGST